MTLYSQPPLRYYYHHFAKKKKLSLREGQGLAWHLSASGTEYTGVGIGVSGQLPMAANSFVSVQTLVNALELSFLGSTF